MPHKGYKQTKDHKQKILESCKGKQIGENHPMYGKHHSAESKRKTSMAMKEKRIGDKNPMYGRHHSEEHRRKMSEAMKGSKNPSWRGGEVKTNCEVCGKEKYFKPSHINRGGGKFCSRRCNSIWTNKHMTKKDTDIERLIEDELIRREIPYTKQVPLLGITIVDFLLPHDTVIYCDGDYWHSKKDRKERDANQSFMLKFHGYKVFRFLGKDIKKSAKKCIEKVINGNQMELSVVTEKELARIGV